MKVHHFLILAAAIAITGCKDEPPTGITGGDQIPTGNGRIRVEVGAAACSNADTIYVVTTERALPGGAPSRTTATPVPRGQVSRFTLDTGYVDVDFSFEPRPTGYNSQHNRLLVTERMDTTLTVTCE